MEVSSVVRLPSRLSSVAGDGAAGAQLLQIRRAKAPIAQRLFRMLAWSGGWALDCAGRTAKTRRRRRLCDAVLYNESSPTLVMRVLRRLVHAQDRRETNIGAFHDFAPFVAGLGQEECLEPFFHPGP